MFTDPVTYQSTVVQTYGKAFITLFLEQPMVVISDPKILDQLFYSPGASSKIVANWPDVIANLAGREAVGFVNGKTHAKLRREVLSLFGMQSINNWYKRLRVPFNNCVDSWIATVEKDGQPHVDTLKGISAAVFDAMCNAFVGDDIGDKDRETLQADMDAFGRAFLLGLPVNLPFTAYGKAMKARESSRAFLRREFQRRQELPDKGASRTDAFQQFIESGLAEGRPMHNEDNTHSIFWASLDTTRGATVNVFYQLLQHPEVFGRINDEITAAFGEEGIMREDLVYSDLIEKLPYTNAVLKEALRCARITPFIMPEVSETMTFLHEGKEYTIPPGYKVFAALWTSWDLNPEYVDPERFNPERFLQAKDEKSRNDFKSSFPIFGLGSRACAGKFLAMAEMLMFVCLLSKRRWTLEEPATGWSWDPLYVPRNGLKVRCHKH